MSDESIKRTIFKWVAIVCFSFIVIIILFILPSRWLNPATTIFLLADDNIESVWVYQRWQPLNEIASMVQLAVIAAEDQKFSQYYGFNFKEIKKIITQKGGSSRGASTISQQLVKNVFL